MSQEAAVSAEAQGVTEVPAEGGQPEPQGSPNPNQHEETLQGSQEPAGETNVDSPGPQDPPEAPEGAQEAKVSEQQPEKTEPEPLEADQVPPDPDGYRFNLPEGVPVDPVLVQGLKRFAFNKQWDQGTMNSIAEFWAGYSKFQHNQRGKQLESWSNALHADWGRDFHSNRRTALKGLEVAGETTGNQLRDLLNTSGALNNPAVMKFLHAVGTLMKEDSFVRGAPRPVTIPRDPDGRPILRFNKM